MQFETWTDPFCLSWEIYKYVVDDPDPQTTTNLTVPRNQGRETMAYLTFSKFLSLFLVLPAALFAPRMGGKKRTLKRERDNASNGAVLRLQG